MKEIEMRAGTSLAGRAAALLASLLIVGTAAATDDTVARDANVATGLFAVRPVASLPVATPEPIAGAAASASPDGLGPALGGDVLAGLRGGDDRVDNTIRVDGLVTDNHAENILSGTNTVSGGAFFNANGINTVIQNSGSNVLVQNAMIVNVQFGIPGP